MDSSNLLLVEEPTRDAHAGMSRSSGKGELRSIDATDIKYHDRPRMMVVYCLEGPRSGRYRKPGVDIELLGKDLTMLLTW